MFYPDAGETCLTIIGGANANFVKDCTFHVPANGRGLDVQASGGAHPIGWRITGSIDHQQSGDPVPLPLKSFARLDGEAIDCDFYYVEDRKAPAWEDGAPFVFVGGTLNTHCTIKYGVASQHWALHKVAYKFNTCEARVAPTRLKSGGTLSLTNDMSRDIIIYSAVTLYVPPIMQRPGSTFRISARNGAGVSTIVAASYVTAVAVAGGGSGYSTGDLLAIGGGTTQQNQACVVRVDSVSGGAITGATVIQTGWYTTLPGATGATVTGGSGSGATFDLTTRQDQFNANEGGTRTLDGGEHIELMCVESTTNPFWIVNSFSTRNTPVSSTTANLSSAAHSINTAGKFLGREVYNTTTSQFYKATGSTATSVWKNMNGGADITPA